MKLPRIEQSDPLWRDRYAPIQTQPQSPIEARTWSYEHGFQEVWHSHAEAQLIYVTRGVLRVLTATGIWTLTPMSGVWLPPATLHELHAIGEVSVRTAYIHADQVTTQRPWQICQVLDIEPLLDALLMSLASEEVNAHPEAHATRLDLIKPLFLLELWRAQPALSNALPLPQDRRLRSICERMLQCPENNDTIAVWGERVGASSRTVARLFRDETGLSFSQWRQQLRLVEAIAGLALGKPVATIAAELGYQSASAFISMFKKTLGDTPQQYLRRPV